MTKLISNDGTTRVVLIDGEPDGVCQLCGNTAELRPYGLGGKRICFDCAMKPENMVETERRFKELLLGKDN